MFHVRNKHGSRGNEKILRFGYIWKVELIGFGGRHVFYVKERRGSSVSPQILYFKSLRE